MSNIYERVDNGDGTYSQNSHLTGSDIIQQTDIQYRRQKTIQTQSAANTLPSAWNTPTTWIDTDGYNSVAVTLLNDASTTSIVEMYWSNDGTNLHAKETIITTGTTPSRAGRLDTSARFMKVVVYNGDTAAHVMNAWAYLKV